MKLLPWNLCFTCTVWVAPCRVPTDRTNVMRHALDLCVCVRRDGYKVRGWHAWATAHLTQSEVCPPLAPSEIFGERKWTRGMKI